MPKSIALAAALTLCQIPSLVDAQPAPSKHELHGMIEQYRTYTQNVLMGINTVRYNERQYPIDGCWKEANAEGSPEAKQVCVDFTSWVKILPVRKQLGNYEHQLELQHDHEYAASDKAATGFADDVRACAADVDRALADGAPADLVFEIPSLHSKTISLAHAKADIGAGFAAAAKDMAEQAAAEKSRLAAIAKPYKDAGAAGERLDFLVDENGAQMYGVGKVVLSSPKQLAHARVLFYLLGGDGGTTVVRRVQFDGNKLARTSSTEYVTEPGAKAFQ